MTKSKQRRRRPGRDRVRHVAAATAQLARAAGLVLLRRDKLAIQRQRSGRGFRYFDGAGAPIADKAVIARLRSLAVPPAYKDVRFAEEPRAHLQAIGRDAAGRLQYRYHPDWDQVRNRLKADRLARFAGVLPRIRRRIARDLRSASGSREFALASVVELVTLTAIRPGCEHYAKERGTRGAATLLKANFTDRDGMLVLSFKAKGGQNVAYEIPDARFREIIIGLRGLPGRRMFQYRVADGDLRPVRAAEVNAYLKEIGGVPASLKDFRTLVASARVLEDLAGREPAVSNRRRNAQILEAVRTAADTLHNTPAICRKSYVLPAVVDAFAEGSLAHFTKAARRGGRSPLLRAALLATLIEEKQKAVHTADSRRIDLRSDTKT